MPTSVLITGCSPGGIGHALAVEFNRRGCQVIATARKTDAIQVLKDLDIAVLELDVTDPKSISRCKTEVLALTGGKLDILVNNAGRTHTIPALDVDLDDVRATYETNVFGVMAMCQAFASLLIPSRGLIVNISSVSSVVPYLFGAAYSSTKGALNTYSRVLRMELRPFNVRVMVSMTGTVRSNVANHFDRILPPDSLYQPVDDIFKERLTFSQNNATIPADHFARRLVSQALKGEGYLGGWFGRTPDWMWAGGLAKTAWLLSLLPRTVAESIVGVYFRLSLIKRRIDEAKRRAGA